MDTNVINNYISKTSVKNAMSLIYSDIILVWLDDDLSVIFDGHGE